MKRHGVIRNNSDVSWEKWGKLDPYYGVLADAKFRRANLTNHVKAEFLQTGQAHIERVLALAQSHCGEIAARCCALDFGCGVGRVVIPLARAFERVTAVDVSQSMLKVAQQNCRERGIYNVEFVASDDELTQVTKRFDLIHSCLVLQHIPRRRGEKIISHLIEKLTDQGILAIQFPFARTGSRTHAALHALRRNFAPLVILANIILRRRWDEPFMQMNIYDLNRILSLFSRNGIKHVFSEIVETADFASVLILAQKPTRQA